MGGTLSVAGEISSAAAAMAGLILVFFGSALNSFDSYEEDQKNAVRFTYRLRAWPAFIALVLSIVACGLALYGKAASSATAIHLSIWALVVVGLCVLASAVLALRELG